MLTIFVTYTPRWMVKLVVIGAKTGKLSECKVPERLVCEKMREGEKNRLKWRRKEKYRCVYVPVCVEFELQNIQ